VCLSRGQLWRASAKKVVGNKSSLFSESFLSLSLVVMTVGTSCDACDSDELGWGTPVNTVAWEEELDMTKIFLL